MKKSYAIASTIAFLSSACTTSQKICEDRVLFSNKDTISFTDNERLLACGDSSKESWKNIPASQSEYHLKTFLEARAYYHPDFQYKNDQLYLDPGPRLLATSIVYEGVPENFGEVRIRNIIDQPLNPELLNYVEAATLQRLKDIGYACPLVRAEAIKETGAIQVKVNSGSLYQFGIPIVDALDLYGGAMRRFDAFRPGHPFRYTWLKLSENRAENDGIVVSSQFSYICPQQTSTLNMDQTLVGGDKRLLSFGAGVSTEEFPILQTSLKNVRTDENGSSFLLTLYGSQRNQRAKGTYFWHPFKHNSRLHLDSSLRFERKKEITYLATELEAAFPIGYQFDYADDTLKMSFGPSIKRNFSDDSNLNKAVTLFSIVADLNWFTHHYEYYMTDPQEGTSVNLNIELLREISFSMLGTIVKLNGVHLLKLNSVSPSQWIMGFRYGAHTTFVNQNKTGINSIPAQYLHTLGGDQNIRGFSRNELNGNGIGANTSTFGSLELRYSKTLPFGLEPFSFFDFGSIGLQTMALDPNFFYSPGMGMRWQMPFGVIRSTLAHGFVAPKPDPVLNLEHLQFFISFGREF